MDNGESIRIHLDWWGKCRTCEFWDGNREMRIGGGLQWGTCSKPGSLDVRTTREGHCPAWDSWDYEGACGAIDEGERMHPEFKRKGQA